VENQARYESTVCVAKSDVVRSLNESDVMRLLLKFHGSFVGYPVICRLYPGYDLFGNASGWKTK
jgi:hypothetical protein